MLESVKLTNEQILNSNSTVALLKEDIHRLRLTCLGERAAHTELVSILNYNSDFLLGRENEQRGESGQLNVVDNSTRAVYYKVIVEGCEWSIGELIL